MRHQLLDVTGEIVEAVPGDSVAVAVSTLVHGYRAVTGPGQPLGDRLPHRPPFQAGVEQQDRMAGTVAGHLQRHRAAADGQLLDPGHRQSIAVLTLTGQGSVLGVATTRIRRDREESRRLILEAAEELLAKGGPAMVQVTAVAGKVGLTDAAVNYHFGTRDQLLEALLRHGGRRLKAQLRAQLEGLTSGAGETPDVERLVDLLADFYADSNYAQLALGLHLAGWRDPRSGLLRPIVDALHDARCRHADRNHRPQPSLEDTQLAIAALHQALATEPIFGAEFRRSVGLTTRSAANDTAQRRWWARTLATALFD